MKAKVPTYMWDSGDCIDEFELKVDPMPNNLKEGLRNWYYDYASGGRTRIRLDFPLHLWKEIGHWWGQLRWGDRKPGLLKGVTWLELLVDFEVSVSNQKAPQAGAPERRC